MDLINNKETQYNFLNLKDFNFMKTYYIWLFIVILFNACVVDNNNIYKKTLSQSKSSTQFPDSQFLKATGFGTSKEAARHDARAELASIFETKIESDLTHTTRAIVDNSGEHDFENIESILRFYYRVQLKGVRVIDLDVKRGQYTALAILNKSKAYDNWLTEISNCDEMIFAEYENLKKVKSKVFIIKPIQKIWNNWMKRTSLVSRLTVLGFSAPSKKYQIEKILNMISDLRNNLKIYIDITGNQSDYLVRTIGEELTKEGFIVADSYSDTDVIISGNLILEKVENSSKDWRYSRAKVSMKIKYKSTGLMFGNVIESVRRGHLTYKESKFKAVRDISKITSKKVVLLFDPFSLTKN